MNGQASSRAGWLVFAIALVFANRLGGGMAGRMVAAEPAAGNVDRDRITQVSLINALMLGDYDGVVPFGDLLAQGDFGIGTLDRLDGELVVLDGKGWQIRGDGGVRPVPPDMMIPFAMVTPFEADGEGPAPQAVSLEALDDELDERFPQRNNFVAFRIDADLATIRLRSVRGQSKPYRPLAEVARSQAEWSLDDVRGTLVGIRSPAWTRGAAVPGHHWHFLSADRRAGGHVLDCRIRSGTLRHDVCGDWTVKLEQSPEFDRFDLDRDLRREVRQVESMREAAGK